jgi:hypothetical protein
MNDVFVSGGYGLLFFSNHKLALRIFQQKPTPNKIRVAKIVGAIELGLALLGMRVYAIFGFR